MATKPAPKPVAKPPVVASPARTPPKPTVNPKLKPGAPGGPPKSAGQLAFEAKERQDKINGTGRWAPGASLGPKIGAAPTNPLAAANPLLAPFLGEAQASVQSEDAPTLMEIAAQIAEASARSDRDISKTQERGAREKANLEELFARLGNFQSNIQGQQKTNYEGLRGQAGSAYEQLESSLNKTFDGAQAKAAEEANRLGIGSAPGAAEAFARSQSDQDYNAGRARVDGTNLQGSFAQQSQAFDQLMALTRANTGVESASRQAVSMRETNETVDDLTFELQQRLAGLDSRKLGVVSTQGARINNTARALEDSSYSRTAEERQRAITNDLNERQFQQGVKSTNFNQAQQQAELTARRVAEAAAAAAGPSLLEQLQVTELANKIKGQQAQDQAAVGTTYRTSSNIPRAYSGTANNPVFRRSPRALDR